MFAELRRRVASLQTQLTIAKERAERAEADNAAIIEEFISIMHIMDNSEGIAGWHLNGDIWPWETGLYQEVKDILDNPHPGAELLERVNMLEAERDAAIEDIERLCTTYYEHADDYDLLVNTCGEYCVHENKNLCFEADASEIYRCVNFKWRGLTQAKEGRP